LRVVAAVIGLLLGSFFLSISYFRGISLSEMGTILFHTLTWTCLVAGMCSGLFFTSDCLSEEKREGTLGFLFLTDLRGYDVVLGKLLATSLRGFYALLAMLPVLGITQMMGGITGAQYGKAALALVNALFCSLAGGMLISAVSRDSQKALGGTLLILLLFSLAGPVADMIISWLKRRGFQTIWSISSPGYVLISASAWGRSAFWKALVIDQVLA
jgi:ABC-type transport system involved in multi-copper enzyme maturation permease subunit